MKVFNTMAILAAAGLLYKGVCADKAKIADAIVSKQACHFKKIISVRVAKRQS